MLERAFLEGVQADAPTIALQARMRSPGRTEHPHASQQLMCALAFAAAVQASDAPPMRVLGALGATEVVEGYTYVGGVGGAGASAPTGAVRAVGAAGPGAELPNNH